MQPSASSPAARPPLMPGFPLIGNVANMRRDSLRVFLAGYHQHGDVVQYRWLGNLSWVNFYHPNDIDYILRHNQRNYPKGFFNTIINPLVGNGLLTSEGDFWRRQRRLAQPAFHRPRLAALATTMTRTIEAVAERWEQRVDAAQPFNVAEDMMPLTLRVVVQALFSAELTTTADTMGQALTVALEYLNTRSFQILPLPMNLPTPANRRFQHALAELHTVAQSIIAERRRSGTDHGDLLSMLMLARDEETGEGMSDAQLRDEVMTVMLAGHETTAVALSWLWFLLAEHPAVEHDLHDELDGVLGGRTPELADLARLPFTKMVIEEALRLYPPVWATGRQAVEDDEVGGYAIPKGMLVQMSQFVTHRHREFWERPNSFYPEHFTPERTADRPHFAYFPFGGGPRQCIGNNFALMEAQLALAILAQRFRVRLVPGQQIVPQPVITLRPRNGIRVFLERR